MQKFLGILPGLVPMKAYVVVDRVAIPPRGLEVNLVFVFVEWLSYQIGYGPFAMTIRPTGPSVLLSFILYNSMPLARNWAISIFPTLYNSDKYSDIGSVHTKALQADWQTESGEAGYVTMYAKYPEIENDEDQVV